MAFIPALNVVRTVLEFGLPNASTAVNVLNFQSDDPILLPSVVDITNLVRTWWVDNCKPLISNQVQLTRIVGTDQTVADSYTYVNTASLPSLGSLAAAVLPANVTYSVGFKTGLAGRSNRGRAYWVGLAESEVVGDLVGEPTAAAIIDAWEELPATLAGTGWSHVVCSYISGGVPRATAQVTPVLNYTRYDNIVDTQRRRLSNHGS